MGKDTRTYRKNKISSAGTLVTVLWSLFTVLVIVLFFTERFLLDNWGDLSADELVFHLRSTLDGADPEMVRSALLRYGLPAAAGAAALLAALYFFRGRKRLRRIYMGGVLAAGIAVLLFSGAELENRTGIMEYISRSLSGQNSASRETASDFIVDNYVDPGSVEITFPEQKRNLIFLFLESVEVTFSDSENGGAFERNVIPELTELAQENEDFSGEETALNGGISLPGSTWTMGAMFAMATGVPLKVPVNASRIRSEEEFFPEMRSLGTILGEQDYRQELLIGSEAYFGGRDVFYKGHGRFSIRDYSHAKKYGRIPQDYHVFWGYEDEKLFQFAREDLLELAEGSRPFNLTMLTVDTHFEDGYRCRLCRDEFGEQYADVFACSSRQVAEFVSWVQQQDFYENTTIVICGDHPTMDKDFCQGVPGDYQRKTFVTIINGKNPEGDAGERAWREYSTMDLFPTTLAAMNVRIEGERLGLGTNLYSGEETLIEKYGLACCEEQLEKPSKFMESMAGTHITEELLQEAAEHVTVQMEEDAEGKTRFKLSGLGDYLFYSAIEKMELVITDQKSGEIRSYSLKPVFESGNDENQYIFETACDLEGCKPEDLKAEYYVTTRGFEHYKIADLEHNRSAE